MDRGFKLGTSERVRDSGSGGFSGSNKHRAKLREIQRQGRKKAEIEESWGEQRGKGWSNEAKSAFHVSEFSFSFEHVRVKAYVHLMLPFLFRVCFP